jgi:hypothetical protein
MTGIRFRRSEVLLGGALAALAAAVPAQAANTPLSVGATLDDDIAATLYGISAGTFSRTGLDLHVEPLLSGAAGASAVAAGALPIAKSSTIAIVAAHARGLPFVIIAPSVVFTADRPTSGLVVLKDSQLKPGKDFNGKTLGVSSLVDARVISIKAWIDANGGDSRTLKFIEVPASAVLAAVSAGRIDATAVSNTQLGDAMQSGQFKNLHHKHVVYHARFSGPEPRCREAFHRRAVAGRHVRECPPRRDGRLSRPVREDRSGKAAQHDALVDCDDARAGRVPAGHRRGREVRLHRQRLPGARLSAALIVNVP